MKLQAGVSMTKCESAKHRHFPLDACRNSEEAHWTEQLRGKVTTRLNRNQIEVGRGECLAGSRQSWRSVTHKYRMRVDRQSRSLARGKHDFSGGFAPAQQLHRRSCFREIESMGNVWFDPPVFEPAQQRGVGVTQQLRLALLV